MAIIECVTDFVGQVGVQPRLVRMLSTDDYSTIVTPGYCNNLVTSGVQLQSTDFIFCSYAGGFTCFNASISSTNITLIPTPSVAGDGPLILVGNANAGGVTTTISNEEMGQATVVTIPDPGATAANFTLYTGFLTAGTSSGSAGDTSKCNASKVLQIKVSGTNYWIPLFASNS